VDIPEWFLKAKQEWQQQQKKPTGMKFSLEKYKHLWDWRFEQKIKNYMEK
jgi:hypothetical protein